MTKIALELFFRRIFGLPIEMPEIGTLKKRKSASLTDLVSMTRKSGNWRGKATIQGGRKQLRDTLDMPALVASRYKPDICNKYRTTIKQGKPQKVALTAMMRKLIELATPWSKQITNGLQTALGHNGYSFSTFAAPSTKVS